MKHPDLAEAKARLRVQLRAQMQTLTKPERDLSDAQLFSRFLEMAELRQAKTVLLYHGVGAEPETARLLPLLQAQGKHVALPRCLPGRQMEARLVMDIGALCLSSFGIPEPTQEMPLIEKPEIDLILVPALCCDRAGFRLGQGGGYYDRFLAHYTGQTVALCRAILLRDALPHGALDLPVGQVLTERERLVRAGG